MTEIQLSGRIETDFNTTVPAALVQDWLSRFGSLDEVPDEVLKEYVQDNLREIECESGEPDVDILGLDEVPVRE